MSVSKISLASVLFRGGSTYKLAISKNLLGVNSTAPRGRYTSVAARALAGSSLSAAAKISHAATVLDRLFSGHIAVLEGRDVGQIYFEYSGPSGMSRCWYDGTIINWDGNEPGSAGRLCAPFVLWALQKYSPMEETKNEFKKCASDYIASGVVSEENLYRFCDAFYYEYKSKIGFQEMSVDCNMNEALVRQAARTGVLSEVQLFRDFGLTTAAIQIADVASAAPATDKKSASPDYIFAQCKAGAKAIRYPWKTEQLSRIPELEYLDDFVPGPEYFAMLKLVENELSAVNERIDNGSFGVQAIKDNYVNIIMVGKPGTGKTTIANALAATLRMPIYVVAPDKNSEGDLFTGMTKVIDGNFQFVKTPFVHGYENGGIIVIEEVNVADPGVVMGSIGQAVEKPFILSVNGYEEVRRHPMCVIIATMNSGTQGSREPSEAFTSRFPYAYMLDDPEAEQAVAIMQSKGYPKGDCRWVYGVYKKVLDALKARNAEDVMMSITQRQCIGVLRQVRGGCSKHDALKNSFIGAIATKDRVLADDIYKNVIKVLPNV